MSEATKKTLFEYVIIQREDEDVTELDEILVGPECVLALNSEQARDVAMYRMGESYGDIKPEWVEVLVRPFRTIPKS